MRSKNAWPIAIVLLILAIIATFILILPNDKAHSATPEGDFDLWVHEVNTYLDDLFKAEVADQWGAAGWSEAVEVELARQRAQTRTSTSTISRSSGNGPLSHSQLVALSICEGSGVNGWRTGYFGIEAGYPIGHMSWDEQVAWVQRIYAQHGPTAWGYLCQDEIGG